MTNQTVTIDTKVLEQLVEAAEGLMEWQVKNVKVWHNSAYDTMGMRLNQLRAALANAERAEPEPKLWLWKNFVDGKQEYWVFDNLYPININDDDPQTLGDPCGYALFKPSRNGRKDTP